MLSSNVLKERHTPVVKTLKHNVIVAKQNHSSHNYTDHFFFFIHRELNPRRKVFICLLVQVYF